MATNDAQLFFFPLNFMTVCERSENAGKSKLSRGRSFLFSGNQMMHVVTGKKNGGPKNILEKVTQSQQIILCSVYYGPFNCAPNPN